MTDIIEQLKTQIADNNIILFMKGEPSAPQCGFSARVVKALMQCGAEFAYVDILEHPEVRANLSKVSDWPTFPQLFIQGELVGGCDIVCDMHEAGELEPMVKAASTAS